MKLNFRQNSKWRSGGGLLSDRFKLQIVLPKILKHGKSVYWRLDTGTSFLKSNLPPHTKHLGLNVFLKPTSSVHPDAHNPISRPT